MTTALTDDPLPPIPDVSHLIGIADDLDQLHAVSHRTAMWAVEHDDNDTNRVHIPAECGHAVVLARRWGAFQRGNDRIDRNKGRLCPHCTWTVALDQGTADTELAAITPAGDALAALEWMLPDPMLLVRICERILTDRRQERDYDTDHPRWAQLLGHATAHIPSLLVGQGCAEDDCEHDDDAGCYSESGTAACPACSVQAGSWAGEWEGQYELIVPAPCSVLTTMAGLYELGDVSQ